MESPRYHHVQILCPAGGEADARRFYGEALGLREIIKPAALGADGVWFKVGNDCELHIGALRMGDVPTQNRSHFAMVVDALGPVLDRLVQAGGIAAEAPAVPGWKRVYVIDPFGNRVELIEFT